MTERTDRELPKLPEPDGWAMLTPNGSRLVSPQEAAGYKTSYPFYTADQMRAYALAALAAQAVPAVPEGWQLERAVDMLTAYAELIKATGRYAEEHYIPEVEHLVGELRNAMLAASPQAAQPVADTQEKPLTDEEMADCGLLSELEDTQPSSHAEPAKSKE